MIFIGVKKMPKINLLRLKFANVLSFKDEQEIY